MFAQGEAGDTMVSLWGGTHYTQCAPPVSYTCVHRHQLCIASRRQKASERDAGMRGAAAAVCIDSDKPARLQGGSHFANSQFAPYIARIARIAAFCNRASRDGGTSEDHGELP